MDIWILFLGVVFSIADLVSADSCETYNYLSSYTYYQYCTTCCSYTSPSVIPCCDDGYYGSYYDVSHIYSALSAAAIVGIVIGSLIAVSIVVSIIVCCVCYWRKTPSSSGQIISTGVPMQTVVTTGSQQYIPPTGTLGVMQQPAYGYSNNGFVTDTAAPPPPYNTK